MAKSKEELISMIENDLVDPSTNKITGERVKNALTEMVDAMGTGGGNMEYWAVPEDKIGSDIVEELTAYSYLAKGNLYGNITVIPVAMMTMLSFDITALAIDLSTEIMVGGAASTLGEFFEIDSSSFQEEGFIQITKEEFYTTL